MNEIIYLEPDEDITGVIAKVKETATEAISLVIPRGGSIAQSIVNLKLLKREIEKLDKSVSLITKDKISKNLASQVGVTVYSTVSEAKSSHATHQDHHKEKFTNKPQGFSTSGIKINQYSREPAEDEIVEPEEEGELLGVEDDESAESNDREEGEPALDAEAQADEERVAAERKDMAHAAPRPKVSSVSSLPERSEVPKKNVSSRKKPLMIITSVFLLILIAAGAVLYPSADVKITLATTDIESNGEITADKSMVEQSQEELILPAKEYVLEKVSEKQSTATATKDVGEKATGSITLYNGYDNKNPVTIPGGTVLVSSGKTFILDNAVTIPAAEVELVPIFKVIPGQAQGKVTAKDSGESSNVAPGKFIISSFSGTKQEKVYGQSSAALTGGTTKELKVVAREDIDKAKAALLDELNTSGKEELLKTSEKDQLKLIASSIATVELEFSSTKNAGDEAETFNSKLKVKITELAYSEEALKEMAMQEVQKGLKEDEMLVSSKLEDISYELSNVDAAKGLVVFKTSFKGKIGKKIEAAKIQNLLTKSKYGNAEIRLEGIEGVKDAKVTTSPKSWPLLPFLTQRIKVSFDYQKE